eukprot:TRINITY_DN76051_c0_g1_i1.p1 TRINITY_DN76051_c0_g1~~TRINITY_DN76051_c0_g1_i1.p1  ORF type:complete len:150 (+),score=40.28 TRINITY_DN76051_c0_g1_i1:43-492(+)
MTSLSSLTVMLLPLISPSLSQSSSLLVQERTSCTNSCCISCTPDTCPTCYRLNSNPVMCPCVEGEEDGIKTRVKKPSTTPPTKGRLRVAEAEATVVSIKHYKRRKFTRRIEKNETICRPSCCPSSDCTESTCPACFNKARNRPRDCPCK